MIHSSWFVEVSRPVLTEQVYLFIWNLLWNFISLISLRMHFVALPSVRKQNKKNDCEVLISSCCNLHSNKAFLYKGSELQHTDIVKRGNLFTQVHNAHTLTCTCHLMSWEVRALLYLSKMWRGPLFACIQSLNPSYTTGEKCCMTEHITHIRIMYFCLLRYGQEPMQKLPKISKAANSCINFSSKMNY